MTTHDLLSRAAAEALPAPVSAQLLDLGHACNQAYIAVIEGEAIGLRATTALEAAALDSPKPMYTARCAGREQDAARRLLAARTDNYTYAAVIYAAAAVNALRAVLHGVEPTPFPEDATADELLADLDANVPLVVVDASAGINPTRVEDAAAELGRTYETLVRAVTSVPMAGHRTGHGPDAVGAAPSADPSLGSETPAAFHTYAATAVSVLSTVIEDRTATDAER